MIAFVWRTRFAIALIFLSACQVRRSALFLVPARPPERPSGSSQELILYLGRSPIQRPRGGRSLSAYASKSRPRLGLFLMKPRFLIRARNCNEEKAYETTANSRRL